MNIMYTLFSISWGICVVGSQKNIPAYLRECYENSTFQDALPIKLPILIDLIRKAESYSGTWTDMRTISTSMLRRFKFDGIEYYRNTRVKEGVLPFGGTGSQRSKHRIIQELIPGDAEAFPSESLTLTERCTLHRAISNTIWEHEAASQDKLCIEAVTEKILDRGSGREIAEHAKICPLEYGVVLTSSGTIAAGAVISAIAASLQPQNVTMRLLLERPNNDAPSDRSSMWLRMISRSSIEIDNIWVAAVAGDLAEMVIYQGPVAGKRMELGATGFWNSSIRPTIYYIMGRDGTFDATRAELIGGIDGLVIAKNLPKWMEKFPTLRLSQVLDMYYSSGGSIFDAGIKACDRGKRFWSVAPQSILEQQIHATSQILGYRNSIAYMSEEVLTRMVSHAVNSFASYTNEHLFKELRCLRRDEKLYPRVEVIAVFDGAWSREYTSDFLSAMMDDIDVSAFGSRIGFVHASTGEWLLNVTESPAEAHEALLNFHKFPWPSRVDFEKVLSRISLYLDASWEKKRKARIIGNLGQAIIFLTPRMRFDTVQQLAHLRLIEESKARNPDVHFIYYVSDDNSALFEKFQSTEEDHLIRNFSISEIAHTLLTVKRVLRPPACGSNLTGDVESQYEDYVRPNQSVLYRLHPYWRRNTDKITLTVHTFGYGTIEICTWNQRRNNIRKDGFYCRELSGHGETSFIDYAICNDDTRCNTTHYEITGISSKIKCSEIDCRHPDCIRYIMRVEKIYCSAVDHHSPSIAAFLFVLTIAILSGR